MVFQKGHNINLGRKLSEEHKQRLLEFRIGSKASEETRRRMSEANKGRIPWNKGCFMPEKTKEKISENAKINPNFGMKGKHSIAWNKGKRLPPLTKEHREKVSKSNIGKHNLSEEHRRKLSEKNKGRKLSPETKEKISQSVKQIMKSEEIRKKIIKANLGKKQSEETKKKQSEAHRGEKCYFWKGGISFEPYCSKFSRQLKRETRSRDKFTCQLCDEKENGKKLDVHHIHYDKSNCNPDLVSLCRSCHGKVNVNRNFYEELFINKLKERGII